MIDGSAEPLRRVLAWVVVLGLLAAACGGDDEHDSTERSEEEERSFFAKRDSPWELVEEIERGSWRVELFSASTDGDGACLASVLSASDSPAGNPESQIGTDNCKLSDQGIGRPATVESLGVKSEAGGLAVGFGYVADDLNVEIDDGGGSDIAIKRGSASWQAVYVPTSPEVLVSFVGSGEAVLSCSFTLGEAVIPSLLECDTRSEAAAEAEP